MQVPEEKKKEVLNRLSRVEGQVRGVRKMIESGNDCDQIAAQLSASHSALEGATKLIVVGFLRECLAECRETEAEQEEALNRFVSLLLKTRF